MKAGGFWTDISIYDWSNTWNVTSKSKTKLVVRTQVIAASTNDKGSKTQRPDIYGRLFYTSTV
jgi:hypothetical protein